MVSLAGLPWVGACRTPEAVAIQSAESGAALTFLQLESATAAVALRLTARGLGPRARIAVLCGNGLPYPAVFYGALRAGCVVAPLSTASPPAELAAALRALRAAALVTDPEHEAAARVALNLAGTGALCLVAQESGTGGDVLALDTLAGGGPPGGPPRGPGGPDAPAVILGTSGTTGMPKRAVHSHRGLMDNARAVATEIVGLTAADTQLGALPLPHSFGMSAVLNASMLAGARVLLVRRPDPDLVNRLLDDGEVTVLQGVPALLGRIAASRTSRPPRLRRVVVSGAPLPSGLAARMAGTLAQDVVERYGMTECSPLTARAVPHDDPGDGDVGRPLLGVVVRVVGGAPEGELEAWAPSMFLGYDRDRRATAAAVHGGFLRTGDRGRVLIDGRVQLLGRLKDLILRGGNNVVPAEIERALECHPDVLEAAVVGLPDADLGERVAAVVTARPGAGDPDRLVRALEDHCRALVATYKVPQVWALTGPLPRTATGKVRRDELRALFPS